MFLSYGHRDVRILNGGLKKWRAEGRAVEAGEVTAKPATFNASYDAKRVRSIEAMIANVASRAEQVIDARAADRFEGRAVEPRPGIRAGHIPGALNLPYNNLFDAATGTMKPLDELKKAFAGAGVDTTKPIVTSCGSGVSAAVLTLALYRLGVDRYRDRLMLAWARAGGETSSARWRELATLPERWSAPKFPLKAADFIARGIAEGPALGHVLTLAEDAWLAADFPLDESALKAIADQTVTRFTRDHRL